MRETWLGPNRRAIAFGCVPPLALVLIGIWLVLGFSEANRWLQGLGALLMLVGIGAMLVLLRQLFRPRIGFENRHVLFFLRSNAPIAVPIDVVEAFFVGQGPAMLPGGVHDRQRTANLVARLSQRETAWAQRDVKPALGKWCDGYVTIRGTWCEPLNDSVLRRLNRRLKEMKETGT